MTKYNFLKFKKIFVMYHDAPQLLDIIVGRPLWPLRSAGVFKEPNQ